MRRVAVFTGTRAEYGLLKHLARAIEDCDDLELQLVVTGTHLSPVFGETVHEIEEDDLPIVCKLDMLLAADSSTAITKSMGLALIGLADAFERLKPDILILLGDRFEVLCAVSAALMFRIPVAHIHGGESTQGAMDDAIRHATTKMSHLHFTANEQYSKRIVQMGESPETVFTVGSMGIDAIKRTTLLTKEQLEQWMQFRLGARSLLVTYHPETWGMLKPVDQLTPLLDALGGYIEDYDGTVIFTMPNADAGGLAITRSITEFIERHQQHACGFQSLGQTRYFSLLAIVDGVLGNSSSGIIEMPYFQRATINVGSRQQGRLFAESIIQCAHDRDEIRAAIDKVYSDSFQSKLRTVSHPYGDGTATEKILQVIRSVQPTAAKGLGTLA